MKPFFSRDELIFNPPPIGTVLALMGRPFDGNVILDNSPYGNHGTITGATWVRLPSGLPVLSYDGTNDLVNCGNNATFNMATFTIEVWLERLIDKGAFETLAIKRIDGTNYGFILRITALDKLQGYHENAGVGQTVTGDDNMPLNTPIHGAYTYDGTNQILHWNGAVHKSVAFATAPPLTAADVILGQQGSDVNPFAGRIGLARISSPYLTTTQIAQHYNSERHLFGV